MLPVAKALFYLLPLLMLLALACNGGSDSATIPTLAATPTPAPSPTATATSVATRAPEASSTPAAAATAVPPPTMTIPPTAISPPKRVDGGTLVRLGSDPPTLDPHLNVDVTSARYIVEIYGGLLTIDKDLVLAGDIAEEWSISEDGTAFTFRLDPGATFHDGRQVTAGDVKWSMERAADPATEAPTVDVFLGDIVGVPEKLEGAATEVSGVQAVDPRTLTVRIDAPKAYFLSKLSYPASFVLDRNNVEGNDAWIRQPNGTGPFRLLEYEPGETLRLGRFEDYHLGPANLDEIRFILSGGNLGIMYENDEVHIAPVGLSSLEALRDPAHPLNGDLHTVPPLFDVSYFGMNANEPPFDDPKVRQAFNYAVDRESLATVLLEGGVTPAKGIIPPGFPAYNLDLDGYRFDPELAQRLLSESKYSDGPENFPPITLTLPGSFGASPSTATMAVLAMWEENLGIEMDILQTEWAIFLEDLHRRRFQMFGGIGWVADYLDPENFLDTQFHSDSSDNHVNYSNPELDLLLERARTEQDQAERFRLYNRAEEIVVEDSPWVPLWHSTGEHFLAKPFVHDYFEFPLVIPTYRYVYFTE